MEKLFTVYRHISPSNKVYIGITCQKPTARWQNGNSYRDSVIFKRAIRKYGWKNFKHEILFSNVTENKAKQLEVSLIRHYKNLGLSYNITDGGDGVTGFHHTPEQKELISKRMKIWCNTPEGKEQCSRGGRTNKGKKYNRKSGFSKGSYNMREVLQFSLTGEFIAKFKSMAEASRLTHSNYCQIRKCLIGLGKTANNFIWKYEESKD